jgi:serine/threonine protein kinase
MNWLHPSTIVDRELKPSDVIVMGDGGVRICSYATSLLKELHDTRASQIGGPNYMAPEIYDDEHGDPLSRDPKTDVFSFGLIVDEVLCGVKMFPATMSATTIMRRAMSTPASDRPVIPDNLHPIVRELMTRSWVPAATKRPTGETLWKRMRGVRFKVFPGVTVAFTPLE